MLDKIRISATIVIYKENAIELSKTIDSFLNTSVLKKLYLVDNSPTNSLKIFANHPDVEYIFNSKNIGFAAGHNIVLNNIKEVSDYHLILNPDVSFDENVIPNLIQEIEDQQDVAMIAPRVIFPNGMHQYTCRKYPTFVDLVIRRFGFFNKIFSRSIEKREYQNLDLTKPFYPNFIHGCFQLFKTQDFVNLNGFDERYFLYMEDVDICRKIDIINKKKLYYPKEKIVHTFKKDSSKNLRLFFVHLKSSIQYFQKWR